MITVHAEACTHLDRTLHLIQESGCKCGVAINPSTPVSVLEHVLSLADMILIMSVNPGFGLDSPIFHTVLKKFCSIAYNGTGAGS